MRRPVSLCAVLLVAIHRDDFANLDEGPDGF